MDSVSIKIRRSIKEGFEALRCFGWSVAVSRVNCVWGNDSIESIRKHNDTILAYLKKNYAELLNQYALMTDPIIEGVDTSSAPIWVFWMQGEEQMPELVRMCQRSRERFFGHHPIILLDQKTIRDYVNFPEDMWEKASTGQLKVQHLADMIRVQLIRKFGGLWLDASIYCHREIPETIFEYPVFSLKGEYMPQFVSGNRWTTFLIGGHAGNVLCSFLDDFFSAWAKRKKPFIHYFMFDCAIALAYENIPQVRKDIDALPAAEGNCYWLNEQLMEPVSEELLKAFNEEPAIFYKIAWNKSWANTGKNTLYDYLLNQ